jgi:HAD superfamily hydrolase (TIGR01509 family)
MMGMSAPEWSRYLHEVVGLSPSPEEIDGEVVRRMIERYRAGLPVVVGAVATVRALGASGVRLAIASSSNRPLIDAVLESTGLGASFETTVSSEEVARGKPAPDVYLEAAARLGVDPRACVAIEDSTNGIRAAAAAGMPVIAYPNTIYPPTAEALGLAVRVVDRLEAITPALVAGL